MPDHTHVLLATLGGKPQVVTFTLDLLLKEFPITEVIVIHPNVTAERLQQSLARLRAEFVGNYYQAGRVLHFRSQILQYDGKPIDDITDDQHADGVLDTIHRLIGDLKRQGCHIHLSITGGRRLMSLLAVSVAALNFDRHDHIWHIYTPEEIKVQAQEHAMMHVDPDAGIKLVKGPFISLGAHIYHQSSFRNAQEERRLQMEAQERTICARVVNQASQGQRKVLLALSRGLRPQQVADQLHLGLSTVHSHRTALLQLCRNAWNIEASEPLDYHFLQTKFAGYFDDHE